MALLTTVFKPKGPIREPDLFRGREKQMWATRDVIQSEASHAVVFGERGVGKTSLAAIAQSYSAGDITLSINCDSNDTFESLWGKVVDDLTRFCDTQPVEDPRLSDLAERATERLYYDELNADHVRHALRVLSEYAPVVIVFDEYDLVDDSEARSQMADTIKALSDHYVPATLLLVGVADDVKRLIDDHRSTARSLSQIHMQRMEPNEIEDIITTGYETLGLTIPPDVLYAMTHLPQGLPSYAHRLAQEAARRAILDGRDEVTEDDLKEAVKAALHATDESLTTAYTEAIASAHKNNKYEIVILAAAFAEVDPTGFFLQGALREPLRDLTGEQWEIPRYARHLYR